MTKLLTTHYKLQTGVTMLLAVLAMSGITLVALAVAAFAVQEIRSSRAVAATEPAYNAAYTGTEYALWALKRTGVGSVPDCLTSITTVSFPASNSSAGYCKTYASGTYSLTAGQPKAFFLYNPNDPSGDTDLSEFPYEYLSVSNASNTFTVSVEITRLDGTEVGSALVPPNSPGAVIEIPIIGPGPNVEARMKVRMEALLGDAVVLVNTNLGLPDRLALVSDGCNTRTIDGCTSGAGELFTRKVAVIIGNEQLADDTGDIPTDPTRTLNTSVISAGGTGQITGAGIFCNPTCQNTYTDGVLVQLTGVPNGGSVFTGWGGDCASAGTGVCTLVMNQNRNVTATFGPEPPPTLTITGPGCAPCTHILTVAAPYYLTNTAAAFTIRINKTTNVRIKGVAGGGGGGAGLARYATAGGGGGGGAANIIGVPYDLVPLTDYVARVGTFGSNGTADSPSSTSPGTNGGSTTLMLGGCYILNLVGGGLGGSPGIGFGGSSGAPGAIGGGTCPGGNVNSFMGGTGGVGGIRTLNPATAAGGNGPAVTGAGGGGGGGGGGNGAGGSSLAGNGGNGGSASGFAGGNGGLRKYGTPFNIGNSGSGNGATAAIGDGNDDAGGGGGGGAGINLGNGTRYGGGGGGGAGLNSDQDVTQPGEGWRRGGNGGAGSQGIFVISLP
jgi:hypothetical protein